MSTILSLKDKINDVRFKCELGIIGVTEYVYIDNYHITETSKKGFRFVFRGWNSTYLTWEEYDELLNG